MPSRQRQAAQRQQTELAWQAARQAAGGLYQQFGVSQVLLFGSLARAVPFMPILILIWLFMACRNKAT